jgi:hypothetical protein
MLTLDELCTEMAATGRHLTPRAARDWWTKGLLPRPRRRGFGRGRGTETFWIEPGVIQRARATYDLLAEHRGADTAILGLWLGGFPLDLRLIRKVYQMSIDRHFRSVRGRSQRPLDEAIGQLAAMLGRQSVTARPTPAHVRYAIEDLAVEFLEAFYGLDEEVGSAGLASRWEIAAPYLGSEAPRQIGSAEFHPRDEDLATWAQCLREMASLPAQQKAIASSTDYELMRARRVVLFVFGYLGRIARATATGEQIEKFGRRLLMAFGRPAVPILITVLREEAFRQKVVSALLTTKRCYRNRLRG